jgi:triosephosphate isomerase
MARRRLVTLQDIERARGGSAVLSVPPGTIITPAARDAARRQGIAIAEARDPERPTLVYGNWKANGSAAGAARLARDIAGAAATGPGAGLEVAVFPPAVHLALAARELDGGRVGLGAQDIDPVPPGAYTGAVTTEMLTDLGVDLALVGHSERRHVLGDGPELVRTKLARALGAGLRGVLCVGETLEERDAGRTFSVLRFQLLDALERLRVGAVRRLVVAYEPVWAIGTGLVPTLTEIADCLGALRDHLTRRWGDETGGRVPLLYGGSVSPNNAADIFGVSGCDGVLVGGASLSAERFGRIIGAGLTARAGAR